DRRGVARGRARRARAPRRRGRHPRRHREARHDGEGTAPRRPGGARGHAALAVHALAALALVFAPLHGWHTGASGTTRSLYGPGTHQESAAWIANVRYRDRATSDPPNETLAHLPPKGIVVWAVIYDSAGPPRK